MASFTDVANGASAQASDVQQLIDAAKGTTGKGVPISYTAVNDAVNFAMAVKNNDATASKALIVYKSDGTVLFQADKNGVIASADGVTGAAQIPTLTATQTFTNKTLTNPVLNGAVTGTAGFAAFGTWTPTISQPGALATSSATGFYTQIGKLVVASVNLTANASGTAGSDIVIGGIPVPAQQRGAAGFGYYQKTTGGQVWTVTGGLWPTTTTLKLAASVAAGTFFGTQPAVTVVAGDTLTMTLIYEAV